MDINSSQIITSQILEQTNLLKRVVKDKKRSAQDSMYYIYQKKESNHPFIKPPKKRVIATSPQRQTESRSTSKRRIEQQFMKMKIEQEKASF